jgi:hypothetical protein
LVHYIEGLRVLLNQLPPTNRAILKSIFTLMYDVSRQKAFNLMGAKNLATSLAPSLLWEFEANQDQIKIQIELVRGLIKHANMIFCNVINSIQFKFDVKLKQKLIFDIWNLI